MFKEDKNTVGNCWKKAGTIELPSSSAATLSRINGELRWFTNEKLFTVKTARNAQSDRTYTSVGIRKKDVVASRLLRTWSNFSHSLMVSVGVSALGQTVIHFIDPGVKFNCHYYRETLLKRDLLPDIREFLQYCVFQQDSAPAHQAREMIALLATEAPDFILPTLWPPSSPDLNPIPMDYKIWAVTQEMVYKQKIFETFTSYKSASLNRGIISTSLSLILPSVSGALDLERMADISSTDCDFCIKYLLSNFRVTIR